MVFPNPKTNIKLQHVRFYRGVEILRAVTPVGSVYVAWMDKFYSSPQAEALRMLIDEWWMLRRN